MQKSEHDEFSDLFLKGLIRLASQQIQSKQKPTSNYFNPSELDDIEFSHPLLELLRKQHAYRSIHK